MGERENPVTAPQQPPPHPTKQAKKAALTSGNAISGPRFLCYLLVVFWLGSVTNSQWRDFLDEQWPGVVSTSVIAVALLVVLVFMWRHDRKRGRFGGER